MGTRELSARRLPGEERKALIALAAGRMFAEHGYAGARLADIAAAAGVTKPVVYRHFQSKKDLYLALLRKHEDDLPRFFESIGDPAPRSAGELVRRILEHWLDYVRANSHAWTMLFRDHSGDEEIRRLRRQVSERARDVLGGFIAEHAGSAIAAREVEPTAELLRSGLAGLALWWIDRPEVPKAVPLEAATRLATAAIEA